MIAIFAIMWEYLDVKERRDETSYIKSNYTKCKVKKKDLRQSPIQSAQILTAFC